MKLSYSLSLEQQQAKFFGLPKHTRFIYLHTKWKIYFWTEHIVQEVMTNPKSTAMLLIICVQHVNTSKLFNEVLNNPQVHMRTIIVV